MELREIYAARKRIQGFVRKTPLEPSSFLGDLSGGEISLKLENLQLTGSFKIRGAYNKLLQLTEDERSHGVVTASSGNHGLAVGYAGGELGLEVTVVTPLNTPEVKLEAIRRHGVDLIVHGEEYMDAERLARRMECEEGKTFVSAYNDPDIVAGQGTVGLEMAEAHPELDTVLVPVGGGGLISGVGCALKAALDGVEVLGVQSVASPVMADSIRHKRIVEREIEDSVAEGLHGGIEEGSITFKLCQSHVDDFILVQEETIIDSVGLLLRRQRYLVEGAGAVGAAAIMENPTRFRSRRVGVVISGRNLTLDLLRAVSCVN
jgi:threonine dehydratase